MAAKKRNARAKIQLPRQWTTAKVRVNSNGRVQVKISASKVRRKK